ncbi:MAG: translation initiation factor IF-6 [Candidatus Micrarchaeota archaeon]|nr:translation initiation factor IF-6 [Candidatus Micrarchaeota archaeon]
MKIIKAHNFGNPHVGLFAKASDSLAVVDVASSPKLLASLEKTNVPLIRATFGGGGLSGIFLALNSNGAVVSSHCSPEEIRLLKSQGINVLLSPPQFSAAGNNIAANDKGAVVNPQLPRKFIAQVSDCLGVEAVPMKVAGYLTVGACVLATNKGFAAHNRISGEELKELHSILRVSGVNCTANTGVPFVPICAVANSHCAIVGESSTGFEVGRLAEALGFEQG